jgi:hypothetical protein
MKEPFGRAIGARWFEYRLGVWRTAAEQLALLERGKSAPPAVVLDAVRSYPEIARDLAIARRAAPTGSLTKYLERVYLQLHRTLFRKPSNLTQSLRALFAHEAGELAKSKSKLITTITSSRRGTKGHR